MDYHSLKSDEMAPNMEQCGKPQEKDNTAANRFFRNPDLCTLLNRTLIANDAASPNPKSCCESPATSLLAFRGVTREAWNSVMLEHATRSALSLTPQDEFTKGIIIYLAPQDSKNLYPFISYTQSDITTLLASEQPLSETNTLAVSTRPSTTGFRIITHHPALHHQYNYYHRHETTLYITRETYLLTSSLSLAREMFLTQPPQKRIKFGTRYQYNPSRMTYFWISNDQGIRFGDLVERLEREPELLKVAYGDEGWWSRRFYYDREFQWMDRIVWEVPGAVLRGERLEGNARVNTRMRDQGGCEFLRDRACRVGCVVRH